MLRRLLILLLFFIAVATAGGIYKWVDEQGRTFYSEKPPTGKSAQQVNLPPSPPKEVIEQAQKKLEESIQEQQRRKQPQEVFGTAVLGFEPTILASLPKPPISLTMVIRSLAGGSETKIKVADSYPRWKIEKDNMAASHQNFSFSLLPGNYEVVALEVEAQSLSDIGFSLVTGGPRFTVPEGNCVYVGRIAFIYIRLPPGSLAQAQTVVRAIAKKADKPAMFVYLEKGSLVGASTAVDTPDDAEVRREAAGSKEALLQAREKGCVIRLAKF